MILIIGIRITDNENDTEEDKQGAFNINNMLEGK